MAIHHTDGLAKLLDNELISNRAANLCWLIATQNYGNLVDVKPSPPHHREEIAEALKSNIDTISWIKQAITKRVIPEQHLKWIEDSTRQSNWIQRNIKSFYIRSSVDPFQSRNYSTNHPDIRTPIHLLGKDLSISLIDYHSNHSSSSLAHAIENLERLHRGWNDHIEQDIFFKWISKSEADKKVEYFWKWFSSSHPTRTLGAQAPIDYESLLTLLDNINLTAIEKELYGQKAKRAWNQQEIRKNSSDKKQCNFVLSQAAFNGLEKLALKHKLSRTQIIELLIDSESKTEVHITNRLRRNKALTDPI